MRSVGKRNGHTGGAEAQRHMTCLSRHGHRDHNNGRTVIRHPVHSKKNVIISLISWIMWETLSMTKSSQTQCNEYIVRMSRSALEAMTLAAVESYALGDGNHRKKSHKYVENLAYIWGTQRVKDDVCHIHVDRISTSISARRSPDSVTPSDQAAKLKQEVMNRLCPHLYMIGDFHTHPYKNLKEVNSVSGYEFSNEDIESFLNDDDIWISSENRPIMMIQTICRLERVRESVGSWKRSHIFTFDIGEFRTWINVMVGYLDARGTRRTTSQRSPVVGLEMDFPFNRAGDRILAD